MRRTAEFQAALAGWRAGRRTLVVHLAVPDPGSGQLGPPHIGFIVSRSVGGAVERNRLRRRLRHLVAPFVARLPAGSLLVLRPLPAARTAHGKALSSDLDAALRRVLAAAAP